MKCYNMNVHTKDNKWRNPISQEERKKMSEFEHEINFATLSEEELKNIAGGNFNLPPGYNLPPGFDINKQHECPKCGTPNYVAVFSWGQVSREDGHYNENAWIAKFICRNCGEGWEWGIDINDRD